MNIYVLLDISQDSEKRCYGMIIKGFNSMKTMHKWLKENEFFVHDYDEYSNKYGHHKSNKEGYDGYYKIELVEVI